MNPNLDPRRNDSYARGNAGDRAAHRTNRGLIAAVIGVFVVVMLGVLVWSGMETSGIDPTPEQTSGPPGPGSIGEPGTPAPASPSETGSTATGQDQPAANPVATE